MNARSYYFNLILMCLFAFSSLQVSGQSSKINAQLFSLDAHANFEAGDMSYRIIKQHKDTKTGLEHLVLQQQYNGIDIYKSIANLTLKEGELIFGNSTFIPIHAYKSSPQTLTNDVRALVFKALASKDVFPRALQSAPNRANHKVYMADGIAEPGILTQIMWFAQDNELIAVLDLSFQPIKGSDWWSQKYALNSSKMVSLKLIKL